MIKKLQRKLTIVLTSLIGMLLAGALGLGLLNTLQQQEKNNELGFSLKMSNLYGYIMSTYMSGEEIDTEKLSAFEKENNIILQLEKNGQQVEFEPGFATVELRNDLFAAVDEATIYNALTEGIDVSATAEKMYEGFFYQAMAVESVEESAPSPVSGTEAQSAQSIIIQVAPETEIYVAGGGEWVISIQADQSGMFYIKNNEGHKYRWVSLPVYLNDTLSIDIMVFQDISAELRQQKVTIALFSIAFLLGISLLWLISTLFAKILLKSTAEGIQRQSDFVAAASHELRSPLAVVRASLSAADNASNEQEAQKYRRAAVTEAERMSRLVGDLLLLAGGDAGSWKIQREQLDLDTILIETSEQFKPIAKKSGLTLLLRLPEETLPHIAGDADRMRQILAVLLNNAIQHAPEGTGIVLAARQKKNKIEIEVIDQGSGLSDEDKVKVFERFYRVDKSRTDKERFGLGLPVAKELTELHGGSISVHDTPGGGATFRITLPVRAGKEVGQGLETEPRNKDI